jgi:hypothetical protein
MPPQSTTMAAIKHRLNVYRHNFVFWVDKNWESLQLIVGLSIFLIKMLSMTKPCRPAVMREAVWYPLMALAALELALHKNIGWRTTVTLAVAHAAVLWGSMRLGGGLCAHGGLDGDWRWGGEALEGEANSWQ